MASRTTGRKRKASAKASKRKSSTKVTKRRKRKAPAKAGKRKSSTKVTKRKPPTKSVGRRRKKPKGGSSRQEWCVCAHCPPETDPAKRICCLHTPAQCDSVTNAAGIQALLHLTNADIAAHPDLWTTTASPASVPVMTNPQKRLLCYRKLFRLLVGIGQQGHQVALPSCCRAPITNLYP